MKFCGYVKLAEIDKNKWGISSRFVQKLFKKNTKKALSKKLHWVFYPFPVLGSERFYSAIRKRVQNMTEVEISVSFGAPPETLP